MIEDEDLIKKEPSSAGSPNRMRDLQPEYSNLYEEIEKIQTGPRIVRKVLESHESIIIFTIISLIIVITWLIMIFCSIKINREFSKLKEGKKVETPSPITLRPELNCQFNFNEPSVPTIPPKTIKRVRFPSGTYDVPRSPACKLNENKEEIIEIETFCTGTTSTIIPPTVQYATIIKNKPTV